LLSYYRNPLFTVSETTIIDNNMAIKTKATSGGGGGLSSIASIFPQWIALQRTQFQSSSSSSSTTKNYRIVLQQSFALLDRIDAAQPVENAQVYQRAGQLTPSEVATKDVLGGQAWLLRLIELAAAAVARAAAVSDGQYIPSTYNKAPLQKVTLISTLPQGGDTLVRQLPTDLVPYVQVLDLASNDPWGWEEEDVVDEGKTAEFAKHPNLIDLKSLYHHLCPSQNDDSAGRQQPTIVIWQSLVPLFQYHGFDRTMKFLQALSGLQVWTVPILCLSPGQHAALEDAAHALLQIRGGHATLLKQGIREPANVQRETIAYDLHTVLDESSGAVNYRVVEGGGREEAHNPKTTLSKSIEFLDLDSANPGMTTSTIREGGTAGPRETTQQRVKLQLEDEIDVRIKKDVPTTLPSQQHAQPRPQIYMDEDDPEFNDLDEEDPDDDLDI
jgi:hypothetical protein